MVWDDDFGGRRLGEERRDVYGRLIDQGCKRASVILKPGQSRSRTSVSAVVGLAQAPSRCLGAYYVIRKDWLARMAEEKTVRGGLLWESGYGERGVLLYCLRA